MNLLALAPSPTVCEDSALADRQARLSLRFADDGGTTRLVERAHFGPLRVQKPLYPEGAAVCHAIIVHPPGGVVGGDELHIKASVGAAGRALLTTPGAAKWYKANGQVSRQTIALELGPGAHLEWLPQETIFFDRSEVHLQHAVHLAADASYIGGEILCFGRTASGETFRQGRILQRTTLHREGKLLWFEQGTLEAAGNAMQSPLGLAGYTVSATLIAVGKLPVNNEGKPLHRNQFVNDLRAATSDLIGANGKCGVSQIKDVIVLRHLGHSSELARQWLTLAWQFLRPEFMQRPALVPRIWNT
ncbi:urease accessory protein UreD [Herbaspirillum sp. RTI4]|uniref:urease accessory protein UreD n=1 Tax=Herbaspirillum sp. RTI4 TaxID=3048640 RepID=UPI003A0FEE34